MTNSNKKGKRGEQDGCPVLRLLLRQAGIPSPVAEHRFHPVRRWRFDYAWPDKLVALEVDGAVWTRGRHTRGSGFVKDMEKFNEAARLGWRVIKCQPNELHTEATIQLIGDTLKGAA